MWRPLLVKALSGCPGTVKLHESSLTALNPTPDHRGFICHGHGLKTGEIFRRSLEKWLYWHVSGHLHRPHNINTNSQLGRNFNFIQESNLIPLHFLGGWMLWWLCWDYVELIHSNVRRPSQKVHLKTDFHGIEWFVCLELWVPAFAEQRFVLRAANDPFALTITVMSTCCV